MGGFHLLGEATVADDGMIRGCINKLGPVLAKMCQKPTVLIPPLPRFVFGGCCKLKDHAAGSGTGDSPKNMIEKISHVRKIAKGGVQNLNISNWWMADTLGALGGEDALTELKHVTAKDNVHFTGTGYAKIGEEIKSCLAKITGRSRMQVERPTSYYWHGFNSPNGAMGPRRGAQRGGGGGGRGSLGRGGAIGLHRQGRRPHPYNR